VREAFAEFFGTPAERMGMSLVYDVAHNIAKMEKYEIDGKLTELCVHRKGATRAFPAGHPELPARYKSVGQPVLVPGDMGRTSFVMVGEPKAMDSTFGSCCHGAGRVMSRKAAINAARGRSIKQELADRGVVAMARGRHGLDEEQPEAYKDVIQVVDVLHNAGISRRVAKLRPVGVMKG
jgi:tRNA-splicing ligase RtcB